MTVESPAESLNNEIKLSTIELLAPSSIPLRIPEVQKPQIRDLIRNILGDNDVPEAGKSVIPPYLVHRSAESTAVDLVRYDQTLAEHPSMPPEFKKEVIRRFRDALERLDVALNRD